jgi:hypothetical protein
MSLKSHATVVAGPVSKLVEGSCGGLEGERHSCSEGREWRLLAGARASTAIVVVLCVTVVGVVH